MNTNILNGEFAPVPHLSDTALISNASVILTAENSTLTLYSADSPNTVLLSATLPSPPLCALDCGNTIIIMTLEAVRHIVNVQGQWTLLPEESLAPAVSFFAEPQGIIQASTPSFISVSGTSLADGIMPGSSLQRKITSALTGAYTSLTAAAHEAGLFMQPVIARCQFVDAGGATVAVSTPQIVGLPDLWQVLSPVSASVTKKSDTNFTIAPFTLSATPWKLHLDLTELSSHPHFSRIASVRVLISNPLDFLDTKVQSPVRFSHTHGNSPECTAAVPGATVALSPSIAPLKDQAVKAARSASGFYLAATLPPSADGAVIAAPIAPEQVEVRQPCRFSASCVTHSGDTVLWGDTHRLPPLPIHPADVLSHGSETLTVTVELLSGSDIIASHTAVAESVSRTPRPILFSDCPDADAVKITFADSGETVTVPVLASSADSHRGGLLSASLADPLVPVASVPVSSSRITAVTPACRSRSAWDFSRAHFYAFSQEGTHVVSFSPKAAFLSSSLIDNRPAAGPAVFTPAGVFSAVQGGLALFSGSNARFFYPLPEDAVELHYNPSHNLVLAVSAQGSRYWITPQGESALIAPMPQFVYEQILTSVSSRSPRMAVVPVLAENIEGTLQITADSGVENEAAFTAAAATLNGKVVQPVALRIVNSPHRSRVRLRVAGTASPDLHLSPAFIINL